MSTNGLEEYPQYLGQRERLLISDFFFKFRNIFSKTTNEKMSSSVGFLWPCQYPLWTTVMSVTLL